MINGEKRVLITNRRGPLNLRAACPDIKIQTTSGSISSLIECTVYVGKAGILDAFVVNVLQ
jgi:hypothetical protein